MDADTPRDPGTTSTTPRHAASAPPPATQLRLLDTRRHPEWCLDETTREVGRRGIEAARAALRRAHRADDDDPGRSHHAPTAA